MVNDYAVGLFILVESQGVLNYYIVGLFESCWGPNSSFLMSDLEECCSVGER